MGKALAIGWFYGLSCCGYKIHKGKSRKFYEFVHSVSKRVGNEDISVDKRKIIEIVKKPKRTIAEIKANTTQNLVKLLAANKKVSMNTTLAEIKAMTPQEVWCFKEEIDKAKKLIKQTNEKNRERG